VAKEAFAIFTLSWPDGIIDLHPFFLFSGLFAGHAAKSAYLMGEGAARESQSRTVLRLYHAWGAAVAGSDIIG